jgi:hypothetical protein
MTDQIGAQEALSNYRDELMQSIHESLQSSLDGVLSELKSDTSLSISRAELERSLLDTISSEMKASLVPSVQKLMNSVENALGTRLKELDQNFRKALDGLKVEETNLESKITAFESKLRELKAIEIAQASSNQVSSLRNPYADIEACAMSQDWRRAFEIAVSVTNGMDFLTHLLRERYQSVEEFFNSHPLIDSHLSLRVCINLAKELVNSDKYMAYKLEMINELVLSVSADNSLGMKFSELKDILGQLVAIVPPSPLASRLREVLKIVLATDRLMTPNSRSAPSTPVTQY